MKKLNTAILASLIAVASLTSCGSNSAQKSEAADNQVAQWNVDSVLLNAPGIIDQEVTFEGVCSHACQHGATKIFLMGSDDTQSIRVEAADLGAFDTKCVNSLVNIHGILREQRIDEAYLQEWEQLLSEQVHGEDAEVGCESERTARGESANTTIAAQIADYRARIAERDSLEGKPYLSFYYVDALSYDIEE